jgi:hypothetical protein
LSLITVLEAPSINSLDLPWHNRNRGVPFLWLLICKTEADAEAGLRTKERPRAGHGQQREERFANHVPGQTLLIAKRIQKNELSVKNLEGCERVSLQRGGTHLAISAKASKSSCGASFPKRFFRARQLP